ncbi:MAG: prepilin-type N-terminal cleavage/methylation domain-containing protein [Candidatus Krumholzibacteriia bacterium]
MNQFRRQPGRKGFTMIELMVVVIIVGVLAAIAIPVYGKYVKNARLSEGTGRMGEIITASKAWAQEHQNLAGNPLWPDAASLTGNVGILDSTPTDNFTYAITSGGGADATVTPLEVTATGTNRMAGVTVVITVPNIHSTGSEPAVTGM